MLTVTVVFLHNVGIQPYQSAKRAQSTAFVSSECHNSNSFWPLTTLIQAAPISERAHKVHTLDLAGAFIQRLDFATTQVPTHLHELVISLMCERREMQCILRLPIRPTQLFIDVYKGTSLITFNPSNKINNVLLFGLFSQVFNMCVVSSHVQNWPAFKTQSIVWKCNGSTIRLQPFVRLYAHLALENQHSCGSGSP